MSCRLVNNHRRFWEAFCLRNFGKYLQ